MRAVKRWTMKSVGENVEKQTLTHCYWECEMVQSLWKTEWDFIQKLNTDFHLEHFYSEAYAQKK